MTSIASPRHPDVAERLPRSRARELHVVGLLSAPSRVFASFDVEFRSGDLLISYTFWEQGIERASGIHFGNVLAFQRRADIYSTAWHLEAYDRVIEVEHSPWVEELREAALPRWRDHWSMRHFMAYIDGEGAFEVVAEDVLLTPDVAV
jgi:hypothetical protein